MYLTIEVREMSAKKASYNLRGDEDDTDEITFAKKLAQKKVSEVS